MFVIHLYDISVPNLTNFVQLTYSNHSNKLTRLFCYSVPVILIHLWYFFLYHLVFDSLLLLIRILSKFFTMDIAKYYINSCY